MTPKWCHFGRNIVNPVNILRGFRLNLPRYEVQKPQLFRLIVSSGSLDDRFFYENIVILM